MYGIIDFSHSDPLYSAIEEKDLFIRAHPGEILRRVLAGELDGGMVSLVSCLRNPSLQIEKVATISSRAATLSTLLVSSEKNLAPGMNIATTAHTKTTSLYLSLILNAMSIPHTLNQGSSTDAASLLKESDFALVIGDEALSLYRSDLRILLDIGYEFSRLFSLPPVYAVTVSGEGRDCSPYLRILRTASTEASKLREEAAGTLSRKLGIRKEIALSYYRNIKYNYDPVFDRTISVVAEHLKGIQTSGHR